VVRISPDGTHVAFQAPLDGILNIWIAPLDDVGNARPVTEVRDRNIAAWHLWTHDNRYVVYARDQAGDENWQIWRVDVETGESRYLTPSPGVTAYIQQRSLHFPAELLIAHNERDKRYVDLYRVDIASGEAAPVHLNEEFGDFFTDDQFHVRFASRQTENGATEYLQRNGKGVWERFTLIDVEDALTTRPIEYSSDGRELYWLDSRGRNTAAVVAQDLSGGQSRVLAEDQQSDYVSVVLDPITRRPLAAARQFERIEWQALDPEFEETLAFLTQDSRGDLLFAGMSQDRRHILYAYQYDDAPLEYFHYDHVAKHKRRLFGSVPALENAPLVPMTPSTIRSRDGLDLHCYLSLPDGAEAGAKLPMVLLVHGGPWGRDAWGLSANHQWLANRGYAVLSVNFRGSTGFGKAFVNAANLEWAGKMHDDLIDAVDWAIAEGIADPSRIAIMGGSYGGYDACRADVHAGEIRLRHRPRRNIQPGHFHQHDPRILEALEIAVEDPDGRFRYARGPSVSRGTLATQQSGPDRATAPDRSGSQRRSRQGIGIRSDRRRDAEARHSRYLHFLSRRRSRPRARGKPPVLCRSRRGVSRCASGRSVRALR